MAIPVEIAAPSVAEKSRALDGLTETEVADTIALLPATVAERPVDAAVKVPP